MNVRMSKWDERFAVDEYVFGKDPNDFLVKKEIEYGQDA
jgi:hypothetical protein